MSDLAKDKAELANTIANFATEHGGDELAKLLGRTLLGIVYHAGAEEAGFESDVGYVHVVCAPVPETQKS